MSATFNPAKWTSAQTGVPTSFARAANIPSTSTRIRLLNGVEVDQRRYEYFSDALKSFANQVATQPHQVPRLVQQLGHKLVDMHIAELRQYGELLSKHYDKPHKDRWDEHRAGMRRSLAADPELGGNRHDTSVNRSKSVIELYGQHKGAAAKDALLKMAAETGAGDHPEMHRFLNAIADLVETRTPREARGTSRSAKMYAGEDPTARKPARAPTPPMPAKPKAASKASTMYDSPYIASAPAASAPRTRPDPSSRTKLPAGMTAGMAGKAVAAPGKTPTQMKTKSHAKRLYG